MIKISVRAAAVAAAFTGLFAAACQREQSTTTITTSTETQPATTSAAPAPSPTTQNPITVYSGRNEKLIGPLLKRFTEQTGIKVEARYGESAEMAATILEEGAKTPADVFISQDAGALGAVAAAGLTKPLPGEIMSRVAKRWADPQSRWVGLSGRARAIVYSTERMKPEQLPQALEALGDPKFRGRFGIAPTNASFQAQMAVYNALKGEAALETLLDSLVANKPRRYANNAAIVNAVGAGEIDFGLTNHYYLWAAKKQKPELKAANFFMAAGDASSFVNMAGAAVLSDQPEATALVRFLLNDESQRYFAQETFEYPLVASAPASAELTPIDQLRSPDLDFAKVSSVLPKTLEMINASGLTRE